MAEATPEDLRAIFRERYRGVVWPDWPDDYNKPVDGAVMDGMLWWTAGKFVVYIRDGLSPVDLLSVWKAVVTLAESHERQGPTMPWAVMSDGSHLVGIAHQFAGEAGLQRLRDQVPAVEDLD